MSIPNFKEGCSVAILGATGLVGRAMVSTLENRNFPVSDLRLLATERSAGVEIGFHGKTIKVEAAGEGSFAGVDICLFSAGADASRKYAPLAVKAGALVIDNSSAYRMDDSVPLVVPEVNQDDAFPNTGVIANPNCSTIQFAVAIKPLLELGIEHIFVSTYQSVSGMGQKGVDTLMNQIGGHSTRQSSMDIGEVPLAFNTVPRCDEFTDNGYTVEEMKIINESRKILHSPDLRVAATAVRVPVVYGHSESVTIVFQDHVPADRVRSILAGSPGITVVDDPANDAFPHPAMAEGSGQTFVGRIRNDLSDGRIVHLFIVADNILKGAAWNAVQIAELAYAHHSASKEGVRA